MNAAERPIRVALVQRVLSPYRVPVFERLAARPEFTLRVFFGDPVKGTKIKNAADTGTLDVRQMKTFCLQTKSSGRNVPLLWHPALFFRLMAFSPRVILCEGNSNILNNIFIYLYAFLFRRKIVWWSLGQLPNREYRGLSSLYMKLVQFLERRADGWLGYSSMAVRHFLARGYPRERVFLAVNCVDTDAVFRDIDASASRVDAIRSELRLDDRWVILFVGALEAQKRLDRLFRAFARTRNNNPNATLLIVGGGAARPELEALARTLNIENDVRFVGEVREGVSAYFLLANAFVLPGLGGLAVPQAMAHALPVICGPADGTEQDFVIDNQTGRVFSGSTDEEIEREIESLLAAWAANPAEAARLGQNAKMLIETKYNIHTFVASIADCLLEIAGRNTR
ncbi:MAG: glycosyltransferase [Phycisphaerae bacterium]